MLWNLFCFLLSTLVCWRKDLLELSVTSKITALQGADLDLLIPLCLDAKGRDDRCVSPHLVCEGSYNVSPVNVSEVIDLEVQVNTTEL